jgi:succinoglycan biosynthesis protein ExoL
MEVVIRGRISDASFPDFKNAIDSIPLIQFAGPYRSPNDLLKIYSDVHFSWAIDYYESGQNSAWLLPNRIYEGSLYGAVPIALAGVETGRWLAERKAGAVFDEPLEQHLFEFFHRIEIGTFSTLAEKIDELPRGDLLATRSDCRALVDALAVP